MSSDYTPSYYLASTAAPPERPRLEGRVRTDVCIVGGGYTGVSAALHLAEAGYRVVLLEAERIGWGASGRNGGQVGVGQRRTTGELERSFGKERAQELWEIGRAGSELVKSLVARHRIDCDLRQGQIVAAAKPRHLGEIEAEVARLREDYGYREIHTLDRTTLRSIVASDVFHGGCQDDGAAHLHPLKFCFGLARAAEEAGARLYEGSRVITYDRVDPVTVKTSGGEVWARHLVLACNGYLGRLEPRLAGMIMPINNFMIATEPLGPQMAQALIRNGACVHDTRFVVNYFRLGADHRLLFGGGENYRRGFPGDIARFVRPYLLRIFPQLEGVRIDYAWGGTLAITVKRLPCVGRLPPNVFYAQGFSGHGVPLATLSGQLIAEAVAGTAERFDVLAQLPCRRFPGGTLLRYPGLVLGMLYYALRDRL